MNYLLFYSDGESTQSRHIYFLYIAPPIGKCRHLELTIQIRNNQT